MPAQLHENKLNLSIGAFHSNLPKYGHVTFSAIITTSPMVLIIPPGKPYSSLEKLLWPFQHYVWYAVLVLLIITFGLVTIFRQIHIPFLTDYFDIIRILLGLNILRYPTITISRYLIIFNMLIYFFLRNCYLGSLFNFLANYNNRTPIDNIDEMITEGYTIYLANSCVPLIGEEYLLKGRYIVIRIYNKSPTDNLCNNYVCVFFFFFTEIHFIYLAMKNYLKWSI